MTHDSSPNAGVRPRPMNTTVGTNRLTVRALFLGERLDLRPLAPERRLSQTPLSLRLEEGGQAVLFRYGTAVLFGVSAGSERAFLDRLQSLVQSPFAAPESEETEVMVRHDQPEGVEDGAIILAGLDSDRLHVVADVLSKSTVLAYFETDVAKVFDRIEPLAEGLRKRGTARREGRELIAYIGRALLTQHRTVGHVAILDKPDVLWEHPELERLYFRLSHEYEIIDRHAVLESKIGLIARTAETLLDLLQNKRSLRVEWYIVLLIVVEILLTLYELFIHG